MDAVDHGIGFAYCSTFVASTIKCLVCDFAPDLAQLSFCEFVVPEGVVVG